MLVEGVVIANLPKQGLDVQVVLKYPGLGRGVHTGNPVAGGSEETGQVHFRLP